ncbi:MAG: hypothetical protein ACRDGV_08610 [Candidatus Limnocylindria bacterium]
MAHVTARIGPEEAALARRSLPESAWSLFDSMPAADRRHGLDVAARLLAAGQDDPDLLAAALLHDAAKGHRMRLWHRVGGVLLEAFAPRTLHRLARDDPGSWRHAFHLYLHHGPMSADAALGAGCSHRTAEFIRGRPADAADASLLAALRAADEAS